MEQTLEGAALAEIPWENWNLGELEFGGQQVYTVIQMRKCREQTEGLQIHHHHHHPSG